MDHIAILRKAKISKNDNLLQDILGGTKTIESRWYVNKVSPWDKVKSDDTIYFKESGCPVTAKARVGGVIQFDNLDETKILTIITKYGKYIAPRSSIEDFKLWGKKQIKKRYCILIFLENVAKIEPFNIDKTGFGISSAWLAVGDISKVKVKFYADSTTKPRTDINTPSS